MAFSMVHKTARKFLEIRDEVHVNTLGHQYSVNSSFKFLGITSSEGVIKKPIPTAVVS